jgi:hypothetical protein
MVYVLALDLQASDLELLLSRLSPFAQLLAQNLEVACD